MSNTVTVQDGNGNDYQLTDCECDNTHEQNRTVCRWCWAQQREGHEQ
jgi:hypothetical protein